MASDFKEKLGVNIHQLPEYEFRALRYAEHYGIIEYETNGNTMRYTESYQDEGRWKTNIFEVNLDNFTCVKVDFENEIEKYSKEDR